MRDITTILDRSPEQPLPVGVRAFTLKTGVAIRNAVRARRPRPADPVRYVLVFDTETSTDPSERLLFGVYRYCEVWEEPATGREVLNVLEEGLVYGDDLPTRDPQGYATLRDYVAAHRAETAVGESTALRLYSRAQFVNEVFYPAAYESQALIVGFNLPFDLSRLAVDAAPARSRGAWWTMRGGWSFVLWTNRDGRPNSFRPRLVIKHQDRHRAQMAFTSADHQANTPKRRTRRSRYRGRFLDLKTLAFALTDRSHTLASACDAFGAEHQKHPAPRHGEITEAYIDYGRQDVRATQGLYVAAMQEFRLHPIDVPVWRIQSPASIAKGYLRQMGITPPMSRIRGITSAQLGAAAAAYFGGEANARIRHTAVPVVATDVTSMYPTVNIVARLQEYVTAAVLRSEWCTAEAQRVLEGLALDHLLDPAPWPSLRFFGEIIPEGDIVPVRAAFEGADGTYTMSVNPYTADQPAWYTGFDLARSVLLTGKAPRLRRAFRLVAEGSLATLGPVHFRSEMPIDPRTDDIFKTMVEARHRVMREGEQGRRPEALAKALTTGVKVFANSGSYGVFAELNPETDRDQRVEVQVACGQQPFKAATPHPEQPGEFYFPPTAALITGAARLLLGIIERLVLDRGGTYLAVDTDSMHIVATETGGLVPCDGGSERLPTGEPAIRALSWAQVREIIAMVDRLKPYGPDVTDSLLKVEKENVVDGRQVQLLGLATATKRYCLFTEDADGAVTIRKRSKQGLGALLPPDDPVDEDAPIKPDPNQGWEAAVWRCFIRWARGDHRATLPAWADRPAVVRFGATSPRLLKPFMDRLKQQPYVDRLKPFNFMVTVHLAPGGRPGGSDRRCRLVSGFEKDPRKWFAAEWADLYSEVTCRLSLGELRSPGTAVVATVRRFVEQYWFHPEAKSLAPDGTLCTGTTRGLLQRRPIRPSRIDAVGKEANRLEEVELGLVADRDEVLSVYRPLDRAERAAALRVALLDVPADLLAQEAGVSVSTAFRFRRGEAIGLRSLRAIHRAFEGSDGVAIASAGPTSPGRGQAQPTKRRRRVRRRVTTTASSRRRAAGSSATGRPRP